MAVRKLQGGCGITPEETDQGPPWCPKGQGWNRLPLEEIMPGEWPWQGVMRSMPRRDRALPCGSSDTSQQRLSSASRSTHTMSKPVAVRQATLLLTSCCSGAGDGHRAGVAPPSSGSFHHPSSHARNPS